MVFCLLKWRVMTSVEHLCQDSQVCPRSGSVSTDFYFVFQTGFLKESMSEENYSETFLQASPNSSGNVTTSCSTVQVRRWKSLPISSTRIPSIQSPLLKISPTGSILLLHFVLIFINSSLIFTCITGTLCNNFCVSIFSCYRDSSY